VIDGLICEVESCLKQCTLTVTKKSDLIILFNSLVILISFLSFNELEFQIVFLQMSACRKETYKLKRKDS